MSDRLTIPVQVNGKLRGKLEVSADADRQQVQDLAREVAAEWLRERAEKGHLCREKSSSTLSSNDRGELRDRKRMHGRAANQMHSLVALSARLSILSLCLPLLVSCGYQFRVEGPGPTIGGTASAAPSTPPPRVVIRPLRNATFEPNLEARFTNYLRHEFSSGSGAQVVPEGEAADLVLSGDILAVILPTLSFTQTTTLGKSRRSDRRCESRGDEDQASRLVASGKRCIGVLRDAGSAVQPGASKPGRRAGGTIYCRGSCISLFVAAGIRPTVESRSWIPEARSKNPKGIPYASNSPRFSVACAPHQGPWHRSMPLLGEEDLLRDTAWP